MWLCGLNVLLFIGSIQLALGELQYHQKHNFYWEYENLGLKIQDKRKVRSFDPARSRLGVLMRGYYEDARKRTRELNNIRFIVEETFQYEIGYLTHELYDKYKKLVEQFNKGQKNKSLDYVRLYRNKNPRVSETQENREGLIFGNDKIERTEVAQKLYFDIYHISNMIHEITRKYGIKSLGDGPDHDSGNAQIYKNAAEEAARQTDLLHQKQKYMSKINREMNRLIKQRLKNREIEKKKKQSKSSELFGLNKEGDAETNAFIKDKMMAQGWQKWNESRNNDSNNKWYRPRSNEMDYGWDVRFNPEDY